MNKYLYLSFGKSHTLLSINTKEKAAVDWAKRERDRQIIYSVERWVQNYKGLFLPKDTVWQFTESNVK